MSFMIASNINIANTLVRPRNIDLDSYAMKLRLESRNASRHLITASGNAQLDGSGAAVFDGVGDYLSFNIDAVGTGDVTVEFYVTANNNGAIFDCRTPSVNGQGFCIERFIDGNMAILDWDAIEIPRRYIPASPATAISTGVRTHIAMVRDSGIIRLYIDGVQAASIADTTNWTQTAATIGIAKDLSSVPFNGKVEDVMMSSVCKYPDGTTFVPPSGVSVDSNSTLAMDFSGTAASQRFYDLAKPDVGGVVPFLRDVSGEEADATGAINPLYANDSGVEYLVFDDLSSQYMTGTISGLSQPFTVYIVGDMTNDLVNQVLFGSLDARVELTSSGYLRATAGTSITGASDISGTTVVVAATFNGANSKLYVNGFEAASGTLNSNVITAYGLGARSDGVDPSDMNLRGAFVAGGAFSDSLNYAITSNFI